MEEITLEERRKRFAEKFVLCQPALSAVGDEKRRHLVRTLIEHCGEGTACGTDSEEHQHFPHCSVPPSENIDGGRIIAVNRRGTMNFYYLDPESSSLKLVAELWRDAEEMMDVCLVKVKERTENENI